jgi:GT2 family glycosyltransferase
VTLKRAFIGIPVLNRADLLARCLAALDHEIEGVIVNNNAADSDFARELDRLAGLYRLDVLHQPFNLGVAASWNLILRTGAGRGFDWVFIGSNDTVLHPGSLAAAMAPCADSAAILHLHAWNFFAVHRRAVESAGWFDENFHPAYKEDQDFSYRCTLAGVRRQIVAGAGAEHVGSATIHSNPAYFRRNAQTHAANHAYYLSKWGADAGAEQFTTPFNDPARDYTWWPDPREAIARNQWRIT